MKRGGFGRPFFVLNLLSNKKTTQFVLKTSIPLRAYLSETKHARVGRKHYSLVTSNRKGNDYG